VERWRTRIVEYRRTLTPAQWQRLVKPGSGWRCDDLQFSVGVVGFDGLAPERAERMKNMPTRLVLPKPDLDAAVAAGQEAARANRHCARTGPCVRVCREPQPVGRFAARCGAGSAIAPGRESRAQCTLRERPKRPEGQTRAASGNQAVRTPLPPGAMRRPAWCGRWTRTRHGKRRPVAADARCRRLLSAQAVRAPVLVDATSTSVHHRQVS
jgi:hypothetical protein